MSSTGAHTGPGGCSAWPVACAASEWRPCRERKLRFPNGKNQTECVKTGCVNTRDIWHYWILCMCFHSKLVFLMFCKCVLGSLIVLSGTRGCLNVGLGGSGVFLYLDVFLRIWIYFAMFGCFWMFEHIWIYLDISGSIWIYLDLFGCLTIFG